MLGAIKAATAAVVTSIKAATPAILAFTTATVVLGGGIFYLNIIDGSYEKGNNSNVRYALEEYINKLTVELIEENGRNGYTYSKTFEEDINKIIKNVEKAGGNISEYTGESKKQEILKKIVKAEIVSKYPDLRNKGEIKANAAVDLSELQGNIKIIRRDINRNSDEIDEQDLTYKIYEEDKILEYIPYDDFMNKLENNLDIVKKYFTLKSSGASTTPDIIVAGSTTEKRTIENIEYSPDINGGTEQKIESTPIVEENNIYQPISINYQDSLSKYSMPAGFLWALLVQGEDVEFVEKLADLAINNTEIIIEVQDSKTTTITTNIKKHNNKKEINKTIIAGDGTQRQNKEEMEAQGESIQTTTIETVVSNTKLNLAYAKTWVATYKVNYKNELTGETFDENWQDNANWQSLEDEKTEPSEIKISDDPNNDPLYANLKQQLLNEYNETKYRKKLIETFNKLDKNNILYKIYNHYLNGNNNEFIDDCINYKFSSDERVSDTAGHNIGSKIDEFLNTLSEEEKSKYASNTIVEELQNMQSMLTKNMKTIVSAQAEITNYKINKKEATNTQTINSNKYTSAGTIVKEQKEIDKANNFITYYNNSKRAKECMTETLDWLYEMLESHEKTKNMIDIVKYLLYLSTETNYGINEFDFNIEPVSSFNKIGIGGEKLLKNYIYKRNNFNNIPMTPDETKYIIYQNNAGNLMVGGGINVTNKYFKFKEAHYETSLDATVDKEFVEGLEEEIIQEYLRDIKDRVKDLELKEYQIHALVSRAYYCGGVNEALGSINGKDFVEAYKEYWNDESDNLFKQKVKEVDFSNSFYINYMSKSGDFGKEVSIAQRQSEWRLFQTGYYDTIGAWAPNADAVLEECVNVMNDLLKVNAKYTQSHHVLISGDIAKQSTFPKPSCGCGDPSHSRHGACCCTYVSVVLYRAGVLDKDHMNQYNYHWLDTFTQMLKAAGWKQLPPEEAQPGDVCTFFHAKDHLVAQNPENYSYYRHAFIYAGGNEIWDEKSGCETTSRKKS